MAERKGVNDGVQPDTGADIRHADSSSLLHGVDEHHARFRTRYSIDTVHAGSTV